MNRFTSVLIVSAVLFARSSLVFTPKRVVLMPQLNEQLENDPFLERQCEGHGVVV